MSADVINKVSP